jgi:hypothetical protein
MISTENRKGLGTLTYDHILKTHGAAAAEEWRRKRRKALAKKRAQHEKNVAARAFHNRSKTR